LSWLVHYVHEVIGVSKRSRVLLFIWGVALACAVGVIPGKAIGAPAQRVYVGVYLRDVLRFDQRAGTFDVDMEVWAKWFGDFNPAHLRVANENTLHRDDLGSDYDEDWHVQRWRMRGTLQGELPLHRFPLEDQTLTVEFELPEREGLLTPDLTGSGMEPRFSATGWHDEQHFRPRTIRLVYPSDLGSLAHEGQDTVSHRVRFEVRLERPPALVALKLFLPLWLILLVALVALFLSPEHIGVRAGIGLATLLACFVFHFAVVGSVSAGAYLTLTDALFLAAYAITSGAFLISVAAYGLQRSQYQNSARLLDWFGRLLLPLGAVLVTVMLMHRSPAPAFASPPQLAYMNRPASTRQAVRIGLSQLPTLMNSVVTGATRWGLVHVTPTNERIPFLAEEVPAVGNDALKMHADGRFEVRWHLRDGLRWSDGHPLTSDDVRFALEVSPNPRIVAIETPDARTVLLTYDGVLANALDGVQPLPRHRLAEAMQRGGREAVTETRRTKALPATGPYRVVEFSPEQAAILEANPHFVGPAPSIKRIELRCLADHAALIRAFEKGELDLVAPSALTTEEADAVGARNPAVVLQRPSNQLLFLQPDPSVSTLDRLGVRVALLQAIDRKALSQALFGEAGRIADVPLPGVELPHARHVAFDPASAREVLRNEGLAGQTIRLTRANGPLELQAARFIADAWRGVGILVEEHVVPSSAQGARTRNHGGMLLHTMTVERDTETRRFWNLPREEGQLQLTVRTSAYDNSVAELALRETSALFSERRNQLHDRLLVLFSERLPLLPLVFASERWVVTPSLRGWDYGPGVRFGEGIEEWHFTAEPPIRAQAR